MLNPDLKLNQNLFAETVEKKATRDGFGEALVELGEKNPNVVVLTADLSESTRTEEFAKQFPERFFEVGVAEQNMVAIAAGLGSQRKNCFCHFLRCFFPRKKFRNYPDHYRLQPGKRQNRWAPRRNFDRSRRRNPSGNRRYCYHADTAGNDGFLSL